MRIAILTSVHPPLDGRIFHKEAISLRNAGFEVTLIAPSDKAACNVVVQHDIAYLPLCGRNGRLARPMRLLQLMLRLRRHNFDVWHFHDPELLAFTVLWKALLSRNVFLTYDVHEDVPKDILDKPYIPVALRGLISRTVTLIENWGIRRCQLVVGATGSIAKRIGIVAQRSITVRNFALQQHYQGERAPSSSDGHVRVIYCGRMSESRGIRELVQAMDQLPDCSIELMLLGDFSSPEFEQEVRRIAGGSVLFHPKVPFEEVPRHLETSDIGIVCLRLTPAYLESLPTKLFEYMGSGLPVIVSDFPFWREIVEKSECGLVVNPLDPTQIAMAIRRLADAPQERERMGQAGMKAFRERYSWESEVKVLVAEYRRLAQTIRG